MGGVGGRHRLATIAKPVAHELDLVTLSDDLALAEGADVRARAVRSGPPSDEDRLRMMRNHAGHEVHIGSAVGLTDEVGTGLGLSGLARLLSSESPHQPEQLLHIGQNSGGSNQLPWNLQRTPPLGRKC